MMNTTLLIMAAGIGSRFGTGIKQLEPVDDANHIIMDYSIHDAIEAGFNHVVFIIRKDIEKEFKDVIGDRIASISKSHNVTVDYAFQDISDIPGELPEGRTKPWGTGQAVLAAKNVIDTPFIVINADDYYGKEGFKAVHEYLVNGGKSCMAGFVLKNTLSDNGGVTRGICKMDDQNNLTEVVETKNIVKTADGAEADGVVVDVNSLVSMNMWGLTPDFLDVLENGFKKFFEKEVPSNPQKAEYLIPIFIGELLEQGKMSVKVLKTNDTWYGMTYHEDVAAVKGSFKEMLEKKYGKAEAAKRIYATTDKARGALKGLADEEGYEEFVVPDDVGGRFSVLTAVGLLPIAVSGADIDKLMEGAAEGRKFALENPFEENDAMLYAATRNILLRKGKAVEIMANYEPSLHYVSEWWKQLFGESEGKDKKGIFPASVDLTTDLHSMGQFIQDGSRIMFETVMEVEEPTEQITIGEEPVDLDGLNYLAGKTMDFVNKSAMNGTILAHTDGQVPNLKVTIPAQDEKSLGQLFYMYEFACGVSGYILGVNPFNQPGVESYKKNMFALLGKPGYEKEREELLKRL